MNLAKKLIQRKRTYKDRRELTILLAFILVIAFSIVTPHFLSMDNF